jgi:cytoskeletal protein RodZ
MTGFIHKKISKIQTVGEELKQHRETLGISPERAAREINLNVRYIKQLEKNDFEELPADIYTINILKAYSQILQLNPNTVIEKYKKEKNIYLRTKVKKKKLFIQNRFVAFFLNPKLLKYLIVALLLAGVFSYIGWEVNKIISPPFLEIFTPQNDLIVQDISLEISGQTEKEVDLYINDRPLLIDPQGNFSIDINLQKGENIIKITAQKRHSKQNTVYRTVILK